MANPPFAGDIKESRIISKYELGKNAKGKYQSKVGRDILFIERNLSFLKDGGRMAIVLPQGRFNNASDKHIRDYIAERCRILAIVVRVSDISKYGIVEPKIMIPDNIVPNIEKLYPKKDTILLSKDGSIGIAYKVQEDARFVTSSALLHLSLITDEVLPDYLALVLNSKVVQMQAERDAGGSIIQHWKPSEIDEIFIPIIDIDKQRNLSRMIQKSFDLQKESEELLTRAIQIMEMAIEYGEAEALK